MIIKKFNEYKKINELYIHKNNNETLNGKHFIMFKKDLWIFNDDEWYENKIYNEINKSYGKEIASDDYNKSVKIFRNLNFDILSGNIEDNIIYIELGGADFRHSEHSDDLFKLKSTLNMDVKVRFLSGKDLNKVETSNLNIKKLDLKDRVFYHGTCLKFLPQILKMGLQPTNFSNYGNIKHDKIFFTLNLEKASFHAIHTGYNNGSFPIIIEFKVPDVNKLIPDYDLTVSTYGKDSDIAKKLNYDIIQTPNVEKNMDYKKDITNKIGIYGYKGRISSSYIENIWIDINTFSNNLKYFHTKLGAYAYKSNVWNELNDISSWSKINKNDIINIISNIQNKI